MTQAIFLGRLVVLLALAAPAAAQVAPPDSARTAPSAAATRPLLLKLGTGLTRGFTWVGYGGWTVPVVLGAEGVLRPGWNLYVNGFSGFIVGGGRFYDGPAVRLHELGGELGLRRYYNQEKRRLKGRAHGPFTGNYLGLQSTSHWYYFRSRPGGGQVGYDYSTLTAVWGLQRRLGGHGLVDAYVGGGVANQRRGRYEPTTGQVTFYRFPLHFMPEFGLKLSLVR
ncbi:hypothetical protein GCM10011375_39030 [Hymenobacter qilianensis]|uniref:Uncharacterized protein n=2 Tax=Hymenobacter qilianensis TaxID=1385715 RepID=A0ACB5PX11_9BACT|nr:hypothetical protein [Hymenobacter qilianensis]QNP54311.1 hypothetical protein H9L05_20995 [Hymenobacter qilianensis]GGF80140.1 hypothetical protein GCM10011375_39030 [Hymenobacter qilianensis]